MKYKVILTALVLFGFVILVAQNKEKAGDNEKLGIKNVLIESYVEGIYVNRDSMAVTKGVYPDFFIAVYSKGCLFKAELGSLVVGVNLDCQEDPKTIQP